MPNFGLGDTPVQISQTGTQEALIQNTGNVPVYLDSISAVSSANHGLAIAPLSSVNWAQGRDLWAVCAPGQTSSLTVLYGATGTALSEVSAVVTGDVTATVTGPVDANITNATVPVSGNVTATIDNASIPVTGSVDANITNATLDVAGSVNANITNANIDATVTGNIIVDSGEIQVGGIDTPVMVQGGGSILLNTTGSVAAGAGAQHDIALPANGLTYYGIGVIVTVTSKTVSNDVPLAVWVRNFGAVAPTNAYPVLPSSPATRLGGFGRLSTIGIVVPMGTSFPLEIDVDNNGASGTQNYSIVVIGLSHSDPYPRDFIQWSNGNDPRISFTTAAANSYAIIAASMEDREFLLVSLTGTVGNFAVEVLNSDGTWSISQDRAHNSLYVGTNGANIAANQNAIIRIPGNGFAHRVITSSAVTGSVVLSYVGKAS